MNITIKQDIIPDLNQLLELYNDVEWSAYTNDPENLKNAVDNSLKVWTAWDEDRLVGLARVVGDGYTIIYVQDILVMEIYQRYGIGSRLLKLILEEYKTVRQIVLMTDNSEKTINFYEKNGMVNIKEYEGVAFTK